MSWRYQSINEIEELRLDITTKIARVNERQKSVVPPPVPHCTIKALEGNVTLLDVFAGKTMLFAVPNLGQGCHLCALCADGINAFLPHLKNECSAVPRSKDATILQRTIANGRNWRFRMASPGSGDDIQQPCAAGRTRKIPGTACYERSDE